MSPLLVARECPNLSEEPQESVQLHYSNVKHDYTQFPPNRMNSNEIDYLGHVIFKDILDFLSPKIVKFSNLILFHVSLQKYNFWQKVSKI